MKKTFEGWVGNTVEIQEIVEWDGRDSFDQEDSCLKIMAYRRKGTRDDWDEDYPPPPKKVRVTVEVLT